MVDTLAASTGDRALQLLRLVRTRAGQRAFWDVQVGIVAITVLHYASEIRIDQAPFDELHHLPAILYVFPIIWASLRYGREGGLLAGAECVMLSIPNVLIWHQSWPSATVETAALAAGVLVGVVVSGATEHGRAMLRRAEMLAERLQQVNGLIIAAQEEERLRIARDLHDDIMQRIVHLGQQLDSTMTQWQLPAEAEQALADARTQAEDAVAGLRRFSRDLRPSVLDDLGLVPALEWLAGDMTERTGARVTFTTLGESARLDRHVELAFFRIAQEALRNVERHAAARNATVTLEFAPWMVRISVEDDGRGFSPPRSPGDFTVGGKLGVAGMQERAQLVGGTFDLRSIPGHGTVVSAELNR
jgi:signal transduction histidine kinase